MRNTLGHLLKAGMATLTMATGAFADDFKPDAINFDRSLAAMRAALPGVCESIRERTIEPAEIPGTKRAQTQIDCTGLQFEGKARLAEFVFRDDELVLVWVLTGKEEEPALEARMTGLFGAPSHKAAPATAFTHAHTALRKDIPEVLFYAASVAPMFDAWFTQMVAGKTD